ncbi:hypothetical protein D9M68_797560 [compost metagenome]
MRVPVHQESGAQHRKVVYIKSIADGRNIGINRLLKGTCKIVFLLLSRFAAVKFRQGIIAHLAEYFFISVQQHALHVYCLGRIRFQVNKCFGIDEGPHILPVLEVCLGSIIIIGRVGRFFLDTGVPLL